MVLSKRSNLSLIRCSIEIISVWMKGRMIGISNSRCRFCRTTTRSTWPFLWHTTSFNHFLGDNCVLWIHSKVTFSHLCMVNKFSTNSALSVRVGLSNYRRNVRHGLIRISLFLMSVVTWVFSSPGPSLIKRRMLSWSTNAHHRVWLAIIIGLLLQALQLLCKEESIIDNIGFISKGCLRANFHLRVYELAVITCRSHFP